MGLIARHVDSTKGQCLVADLEVLEPSEAGTHDDVALGSRLERAPSACVEDAIEHGLRFGAHPVERHVGAVQEGLLLGDLTLGRHSQAMHLPRSGNP